MTYPEHEKADASSAAIQAVEHFLEWAADQKKEMCRSYGVGNQMDPDIRWTPLGQQEQQRLVWEFFDIDPTKIEAERKQMLDAYRKQFDA